MRKIIERVLPSILRRARNVIIAGSAMLLAIGSSGCRKETPYVPNPNSTQFAKLNLDFEQLTSDLQPVNWTTKKDTSRIIQHIDTIAHSGRHSMYLEILSGGDHAVAAYAFDDVLPLIKEKVITYSGWIKIEDVTVWAGLYFAAGSSHTLKGVSANNMHDSAYRGTHDWKRFSFTLPVPSTAEKLRFGVLLVSEGKGRAWFDGLQLDTNGVLFAK